MSRVKAYLKIKVLFKIKFQVRMQCFKCKWVEIWAWGCCRPIKCRKISL